MATARNAHPSRHDFGTETFVYERRGGYGWTERQDMTGTLQSQGGSHQGGPDNLPLVAFDRTKGTTSGEISAPLRSCGAQADGVNDAKADTQCIAFDWQAGGSGDESFRGKSRSYIVRKGEYAQVRANAVDAIAFTERSRPEGRTLETQDELSYALTDPAGGGKAHCRSIAGQFGVRRLTPVECERLQGFPDNWTLVLDEAIRRRGMEEDELAYLRWHLWNTYGHEFTEDELYQFASDSARYRQLGNAVAVPNARWLGSRIIKVEQENR